MVGIEVMADEDKLRKDYDFLQAVAAGDREAKKELLVSLYRRVHRKVRFLSRNDEEAEDLTQDVMLEVLKSARKFRAEGCLEAWVDVIASRTVAKKMKRMRWRRWVFGVEWYDTPSHSPSPERRAVVQNQQSSVFSLLDNLSSERRFVVVHKLVYGYSAKEVADLSGLSLKKVQYHIKQGREELRKAVRRDKKLKDLFPEVVG